MNKDKLVIVERLRVQQRDGLFDLPAGHKVVGYGEAADTIEGLVSCIKEIEALCHSETRQRLLAICHRALALARGEQP